MSDAETKYPPRFGKWERLEHAVLIISFTILSITGIPQKFAQADWAIWMIGAMGGIEAVRIIHRSAAIVLMIGTIYHVVAVGYKVFVLRIRMTMLPGLQDVKDGFQALFYNVGLTKTFPQMGRYTFGEKLEYWAVVWGTVVMIITGFMLWNPILTTAILPGQFIPAAKAAHGGEALLAVLSILTWHFYNVHVRIFNKSMFSGYLDPHEMEEEHPLEIADIEAGRAGLPPEDRAQRQRRRAYIPTAAVISVVLLAGLYFFVTYEQTAITTVPRQQSVESVSPAEPSP